MKSLIKRVSVFGSLFLILVNFTGNSQDIKDFDGNVYKTAKLWFAGLDSK